MDLFPSAAQQQKQPNTLSYMSVWRKGKEWTTGDDYVIKIVAVCNDVRRTVILSHSIRTLLHTLTLKIL